MSLKNSASTQDGTGRDGTGREVRVPPTEDFAGVRGFAGSIPADAKPARNGIWRDPIE